MTNVSIFESSKPKQLVLTMKVVVALTFLFFSYTFIDAQDIVQVLADETCECLSKKDLDKAHREKIEEELAMCFVEVAPPYFTRVQEELGLDLMKGEEEGRKLGELIGEKLVTVCPKFMSLITSFVEEEMANSENIVQGKLLKIEKGQFASILVKEADTGNEVRLYWLRQFNNADKLIANSKKIIGKNVLFEYHEMEVYRPELKDYDTVKEIVDFLIPER